MRRADGFARSLLLIAILGGALACRPSDAPATTQFTEGGVEVTVALTGDDAGARELEVRLRPTEPGFHVYSTTHDIEAASGLGLATQVTLIEGLVAQGPLRANVPTERLALPVLGTSLDVFPDGPVELTLPVASTSEYPTVSLSYAACSERTCLAPVRDRRVQLNID